MELTLQQISKLIDGEIKKHIPTKIKGVATLNDAGEGEISFLSDRKYFQQLLTTKASAVILPQDLPELDKLMEQLDISIIVVKNPLQAIAKLLRIVHTEKFSKNAGIHKSAIISDTAKVGKNVSIGAYTVVDEKANIRDNSIISANCYIGKNSTVGKNCLIYPNVTILDYVTIGDNVIIHSGCVIGSDGFGYYQDKNGYEKIPQVGCVLIEDDVEIGANVTIDRATIGKTIIKRGTKIDNLVHIAHNVEIGESCVIAGQVGIAGSTKIGNNVQIAGQVGIKDHIIVGDNAKIAAKSGIMDNIKPNETVFGYPAREHRKMLKIEAILNKLPEIWEEIRKWKSKKQ